MAKITKPNNIGGIKATTIEEFGSSIMAQAATMAPPSIKGKRRPSLFQVRSDAAPTIGCTSKPMIGAANQNSDNDDKSAPKSDKIRLTLPFCSAKPICTPKKPKLRFQICQKDNLGCFIPAPRMNLLFCVSATDRSKLHDSHQFAQNCAYVFMLLLHCFGVIYGS